MIKITYVTADGTEQPVEVEPGMSLMEVATLRGIEGIVAECGGGCSCATCHVYVDEAWQQTFEEPAPEEADLIEFLDEAKPTSRLSCQLVLRAEHDGLCVRTPASQG
ncbi:2Fe-2S iron-sulfur cluster-binding protein [Arthrobacter sp. I2-34]|uniref:2Fe-2S iron-sulfur cluster-binding protein n=1 Tax=Arthrobacter hankyongi TaxID=2904801 RepID=A0ABS9LBP0_9MICC|nr:2Fe-2S iron-sulfur cluster-binding protein [Arthrobacter hankyongi]MCG2624102.1 2Fe-2S iron-sulfur cluster-binding protein [Arthrobacter hankyongi]